MATDEIVMIEGLDQEGKVAYRQWRYCANQLVGLLASYASISSSMNAKTAIECAIAELTKMLDTERTKWQRFAKCCIDQDAKHSSADSNLKCQQDAARNRLLFLDNQLQNALQAHRNDSANT